MGCFKMDPGLPDDEQAFWDQVFHNTYAPITGLSISTAADWADRALARRRAAQTNATRLELELTKPEETT